ncbi:hypothetical protein SEPCBS119000_006276 [Sporothrix epigloea]|uniref:Uncharacterized protein n=1 Tax=Sporothrix epigloea TaxID=1892477 RepID=A0ABP0E253_9PEZI
MVNKMEDLKHQLREDESETASRISSNADAYTEPSLIQDQNDESWQQLAEKSSQLVLSDNDDNVGQTLANRAVEGTAAPTRPLKEIKDKPEIHLRSVDNSRLSRFEDKAHQARIILEESKDWMSWKSQLTVNLRTLGIRKIDEIALYDEPTVVAVRFFLDITISTGLCLATERIEGVLAMYQYLENMFAPEEQTTSTNVARAYHALEWKDDEKVQALLLRVENIWSEYEDYVSPLTPDGKTFQLLSMVQQKDPVIYSGLEYCLEHTWSKLSDKDILSALKTKLVSLAEK